MAHRRHRRFRPAAALGLLAHLAVLRTQPEHVSQDEGGTDDQQARTNVPPGGHSQDEPVPAPPTGARIDTDTELLVRARAADRDHRDRTGHPITRDALRRELGIGTGKASTLLRELRSRS